MVKMSDKINYSAKGRKSGEIIAVFGKVGRKPDGTEYQNIEEWMDDKERSMGVGFYISTKVGILEDCPFKTPIDKQKLVAWVEGLMPRIEFTANALNGNRREPDKANDIGLLKDWLRKNKVPITTATQPTAQHPIEQALA